MLTVSRPSHVVLAEAAFASTGLCATAEKLWNTRLIGAATDWHFGEKAKGRGNGSEGNGDRKEETAIANGGKVFEGFKY